MIVKYTTKEKELLARLMRAEAVGEGDLGMLMVGNVGINRVIADCLTFKDIRSISDMVYQSPGGFSGTSSSLFYGNPTAKESELAERVISCTDTWWEQDFAGKYKNHCFYKPSSGVCKELH